LSVDNSNDSDSECPDEVLCASEEVEHLLGLLNLDESKASGPNGISATMLKRTATSIASSVTALFVLAPECRDIVLEA